MDADSFINALKHAMTESLERLNTGLPTNPKVRITDKGKGWITLSPSDPQAEPATEVSEKS